MSRESFADLGVSRAVISTLTGAGITEPFAIQRAVIGDAITGRDVIAQSPTGSGKTLAGFLAAIDTLYREHEAGQQIEGQTKVVYLSPLKALAVDVHANLEEPLEEIAGVAGAFSGLR